MLTPQQPPPEDYYQNNCRTLFDRVAETYADLLPVRLMSRLTGFTDLSGSAQRLFARLLTRQGPAIRCDSLVYAEVQDLRCALTELCERGYISINPALPADQLLQRLRKAELLALASQYQKLRKPELIAGLLARYSDVQLRGMIYRQFEFVNICHVNDWQLVKLLYFGSEQHDWSSFVIRDLGMLRYEPVALQQRQFADAQALQAYLHYQRLSGLTHRLTEFPQLAGELAGLLSPPIDDRWVAQRRARALLRVGHWLERRSKTADPTAAIAVYQSVARHPARERMVRILTRCGDDEAAQQHLHNIRQQPWSEQELQFAERFGVRNGGFQPPTDTVCVTELQPSVEQQALDLLLAEQGGWGAHVENRLLRTMTGLLYWPIVFMEVPGAFTNPFQSAPHDLFSDDFVTTRRSAIERHEQQLHDNNKLVDFLNTVVEDKYGVASRLVSWGLLEQVPLQDWLSAMPIDHLRRLCAFYLRNMYHLRSGLPDLLVCYAPARYELVEVKGPNDQLQPAQRIWLNHLQRLDIPSRVLKIKLSC